MATKTIIKNKTAGRRPEPVRTYTIQGVENFASITTTFRKASKWFESYTDDLVRAIGDNLIDGEFTSNDQTQTASFTCRHYWNGRPSRINLTMTADIP